MIGNICSSIELKIERNNVLDADTHGSVDDMDGKPSAHSSLLVLPTGLHHGHFRTSFELDHGSGNKKRSKSK